MTHKSDLCSGKSSRTTTNSLEAKHHNWIMMA